MLFYLESSKEPTYRENDITSLIIPAEHYIATSNSILPYIGWTIHTPTTHGESHGGYSVNGG